MTGFVVRREDAMDVSVTVEFDVVEADVFKRSGFSFKPDELNVTYVWDPAEGWKLWSWRLLGRRLTSNGYPGRARGSVASHEWKDQPLPDYLAAAISALMPDHRPWSALPTTLIIKPAEEVQ